MLTRTAVLLAILGVWLHGQTSTPARAPDRVLDAGYFRFVVPLHPEKAAQYQLQPVAGDPHTFAPQMLALYPRHDHSLPAHRLQLAPGARVWPLAAWAPPASIPPSGTEVSAEHLWLEIRADGWTGWVEGADAFRDLGLPAAGDPPPAVADAPLLKECYAFAAGRLWLACGHTVEPITLGAVGEYALNPEATAIALRRHSQTMVVALNARPHVLWQGGAPAVAATCGTLVWEPPNPLAPLAYDLLARKALVLRYQLPVYCDQKQHMVVSYQQNTVTAMLGDAIEVLSRAATAAPVVGGNGKFIAWSEPHRFCVLAVGHGLGCLPLAPGLRPHSMNDLGAVLFAGGSGIWYWRPGMAAPVRLQSAGACPQWVSPLAALRLRLWYHVQQPRWPYLARPLQ